MTKKKTSPISHPCMIMDINDLHAVYDLKHNAYQNKYMY